MSESERGLTVGLENGSLVDPGTTSSPGISYREISPYVYAELHTQQPVTSSEGEALQAKLGVDHFVADSQDDRRLVLLMNRRIELTHESVEAVLQAVSPNQKLTQFAHDVPNPFKTEKKAA